MRNAAWIAVWAMVVTATVAAQETSGSVRGTVIDSVTRQPVRKAEVSFVLQQNPGSDSSLSLVATTDASGTFAMSPLTPGRYRVDVYHRHYPQARFSGLGRNVAVKAGEETGPITVELIPAAAISGHIQDEDGDPLTGCRVRAQSVSRQAERSPIGLEGGVIVGPEPRVTSDDGGYRLFDIPPGRYIVTAQCPEAFQPRPLSPGPDPMPALAYPKQVYPAGSVELEPGVEKSGIDFKMRPVGVTHIHVTLAPGDWRGRDDLVYQLIPADQDDWTDNRLPIDAGTGWFDIQKVFVGSYRLVVGSNAGPLASVQSIEVKDKPVETTVELRHAVALQGSIEVEGNGVPKQAGLGLIQVGVVSEFRSFGSGFARALMDQNGTFTIKSVFPGPGRVFLNAASYFLKSAWLGGTELVDGKVDLSSGAPGELRIVVSSNTATIRGSAAPGVGVTATEIESMGSIGGRGVMSDANGAFKIDGLAPGRYRVSIADPGGDPSMGENGLEVTVAEGQTVVLDLKR